MELCGTSTALKVRVTKRSYFGRRRAAGAPRAGPHGTNWLNPDAYNALSHQEKQALATRRQQSRNEANKLKLGRSRKKPRRRAGGYVRYQAIVIATGIALIFGYGFISDGWSQRPVVTAMGSTEVRENFRLCHVGGGTNCVVDGDTIYLHGQKIRIAGIDAPETHDYKCRSEKALGDRATRRLRQLLNSGSVSLSSIDRDEDVYGRKLRNVAVNGADVGDALVNEGLARPYRGSKMGWC